MRARYEDDVFAWSQQTAEAIAQGRLENLDLAHLADEISDVGKSEQRALASQIERVLVHLLKIRFQSDRHSGSWDLSIAEARERIRQTLRRNPSLCAAVPEIIAEAYGIARIRAARQTGLALDSFPAGCPFPQDAILQG